MKNDIVVAEKQKPSLLHETSPQLILEESKVIANALADLIEEKKLYTTIQGKNHVHVEGWTTLGALLKVFPILDWSHRLPRDDDEIIYESRVIAQTLQGEVVGVGEAICSDKEVLRRRDGSSFKRWTDEHAVKSMSITRATSKALRIPLGWIMTLAGYSGTPFEEMPGGMNTSKKGGRSSITPSAPPSPEPPAPTKKTAKKQTKPAEAEVLPSYQEIAKKCKPLAMILEEMDAADEELNDVAIIEAGSMMVGRQDLTPGDLKVVRKALQGA